MPDVRTSPASYLAGIEERRRSAEDLANAADRARTHVRLAWDVPLFTHLHGAIYVDLLQADTLADEETLEDDVVERLAVRLALCELQRGQADMAIERLRALPDPGPFVLAGIARVEVTAAPPDVEDIEVPELDTGGDEDAELLLAAARAEAFLRRGEVQDAKRALHRVWKLAHRRGPAAADLAHFAMFTLGFAHQLLEEAVDAARCHRKALDVARQWKAVHEDLTTRFPLANLEFQLGRRKEALQLAAEGVELARDHDITAQEAIFVEAMARFESLRNQWPEVRRWAERAAELAFENGNPGGYASAASLVVGSWIEQGDRREAYKSVVKGACTLEAWAEQELAGLLWKIRDEMAEEMGAEAFRALAESVLEEEEP